MCSQWFAAVVTNKCSKKQIPVQNMNLHVLRCKAVEKQQQDEDDTIDTFSPTTPIDMPDMQTLLVQNTGFSATYFPIPKKSTPSPSNPQHNTATTTTSAYNSEEEDDDDDDTIASLKNKLNIGKKQVAATQQQQTTTKGFVKLVFEK